MVNLRSVFTAAFGLAALAQDALAHSTRRNTPLNYVSVLDNPLLSTPSKRCHHHSTFDLTFSLHDGSQEIRLALEPNHDILHDTLQVHYLSPDGSLRETEHVPRHEHKVFRGKAFVRREGRLEWTQAGWARITVHRDGKHPIFEGAFRLDGDHHHIQTGANYRRLKHGDDPNVESNLDPEEYMVVWRDSDVSDYSYTPQELRRRAEGGGDGGSSCGADSLEYNTHYNPNAWEDPLEGFGPGALFGRQIDQGPTGNDGAGINLVSTIGSTQGCPDTRKIALVGIATDCTYTADFNSSQSVRSNIISQVNAASEVYETSFNISLGIQNLTISDAGCPSTASDLAPWNVDCSSNVRISQRLNLFSQWRGQSDDGNAFWTLLSTCNTDSAVGLAWLGQVCVPGSQTTAGRDGANETVASTNVVIRTESEWQVFAHEAGHTFGAVHDCDGSACGSEDRRMQRCCPLSSSECDANSRFIMNPSTGRQIQNFSPCTIGNVCSALFRNSVRSDCLANNRDVNTITGSQCGNGIVESGEDCDCGGEEGCGDNPCCNPETCRFTDDSVCDPANEDCCTDQCQFASSGTVCRESTGLCDPEEVCPGDSSVCPNDRHRDDGDSCGDGDDLKCASGQCTSRDEQCQAAIGSRDTNNETSACESGCMLSCRSPSLFQTDRCRLMNQNFLDGTPCESGGRCSNGVCQGASFTNDVGNWIEQNRHIVIPVAASVGGLVMLAILWCCISSACKRMRRKKAAKQPPSPPPMGGTNGWNEYGGAWNASTVPPPPQQQNQQQTQQPPGYTPYNNSQYNNSQYSGQSYPGQWHPQRAARTMSMRYA